MSIGERIKNLRLKRGFSQEYVAEKINVSRQAVSKWEKSKTKPDMKNLILLSELFEVSIEYIVSGKEEMKENTFFLKKINLSKKSKIIIAVVLILCLVSAVSIYIHNLPVDFDAGACGGGYASYIFHKYEDELIEKYIEGSSEKENIISIEAVKGTQSAEWEDKNIYIQFDIRYMHKTEGEIVETIRFIGNRYWFDSYRWSGAIISG